MSTGYCSLKPIQIADLFDGRLELFNIREKVGPDSSAQQRCLTDGYNYLWVYAKDDGTVSFTRYFPNGNPAYVLECIEVVFETRIVSEYDPEYWGFESQAQWDAAMEKLAQEDRKTFYIELMKFVAGQPCDIRPGTNGEMDAQIAKELISENPELALAANADELLARIREIYNENAVVIQFDDTEIADIKEKIKRQYDLPFAALLGEDTDSNPQED